MNFEQAWVMQNSHYRVSSTVRVTIQRRAANNYSYIEDFVVLPVGDDSARRHWKIRSGSICAHGAGGIQSFLEARARAEKLWRVETSSRHLQEAAS